MSATGGPPPVGVDSDQDGPAEPARPTDETAPAARRTVRHWLLPLGTAAVVVVLLAVVVAGSGGDGRDDGGATQPASHSASAPLAGRQAAELELASSADWVAVTSADLGPLLYLVTTTQDAAVVPAVTETGGRVRVALAASGNSGGPSRVQVQLNSAVRWRLRLPTDVGLQDLNLSTGRLAGVTVSGRTNRIQLSLPRPDGTVPVRIEGAAKSVTVHVPLGIPARVELGGGAGTFALDDRPRATAAGTAVVPRRWAAAPDRYDIEAVPRLSDLTVHHH